MSTFLFDVKCFATVRIEADSEAAARAALSNFAVDLGTTWDEPDATKGGEGTVTVELRSVSADDGEPELVEVDGEASE